MATYIWPLFLRLPDLVTLLQVTPCVCRFLICNLAAADFAMGLYLGFLAVVDVVTLGQY